MNLFGLMETSGGAMQAERMRAEVVAANMANAETTSTASGGPYRRQNVIFAANQGDAGFLDSMTAASGTTATQAAGTFPLASFNGSASSVAPGVAIAAVVQDPSAPLKRYDPGHPDADAEGYVSYPNINPLTEMEIGRASCRERG